MKRSRKLFLSFLGFVALAAGAAFVMARFSPAGPSPLLFKIVRYQTNANEIVAFVQMKNVGDRIIQFECERGTMRLRCEYSDGRTKRTAAPTGASSFLHPGAAVIGEIPLDRSEAVWVGVMMRELTRPMRFPGHFKSFFVGMEVRIRTLFDYKPCYLPEQLLEKGK